MPRFFIFCLAAVCLVSLASCTKTRTLITEHHKLKSFSEVVIKTNQAIGVYDSDWLKDSIDFVHAPGGRNYKWRYIPDNGCVSFSGQFKNGMPTATFKCAGKYKLHAEIYDSTTKELVAVTDFFDVSVTHEILQPEQAIQKDDTLLVRIAAGTSTGPLFDANNPPVTKSFITVSFHTSKSYEHYRSSAPSLDNQSTGEAFSFHFGNKIQLWSYPFANDKGVFDQVECGIGQVYVNSNTPIPWNVTWLGRSYTGTVTLVRDFYAVLKIDNNDGMIRIIN